MNRRSIAVFLVFLMLSCSVCTGIVFANDEQVRNQPSHNNQDHFLLYLTVNTYEKLRNGKGAPTNIAFWDWITESNYTAQVIDLKTNRIIAPAYYIGNITVWNLTMNEYYSLTIKKEGYITQIYPRITDVGDMYQNPFHIVMLKKSAPLFLRLLGNRINWIIFSNIATILSYIYT